MVAHGWRSISLTNGQEKAGPNFEIIKRQMGHFVGDKVRKAYHHSRMLKQRISRELGNLLVKQ
tara:strand:- start:55 stop:243 length:189 start_codon:yes stop_codon:yes gene_type:complete